MKKILSKPPQLYARAGEKVVNAKGEHICTIARDLTTDMVPAPDLDFRDWQITPPAIGRREGFGDWHKGNDFRFVDGWGSERLKARQAAEKAA